MEFRNFDHHEHWHELLDDLCKQLGHFDNAHLGSELCAKIGRMGREDFEAAQRNLRNWRAGRHVPQQRNFVILSQLLRVGGNPALREKWNALYGRAREQSPEPEDENGTGEGHSVVPIETRAVVQEAPGRGLAGPIKVALVGASMFFLGVAAASVPMGWTGLGLSDENESRLIGHRPYLSLNVGDSAIIHGARAGECGGPAPAWDYVEVRLPVLQTGTFSDGGTGRRSSRFCKGMTAARAIKFTATGPGEDEFLLYGDFIKIVVTERGEK